MRIDCRLRSKHSNCLRNTQQCSLYRELWDSHASFKANLKTILCITYGDVYMTDFNKTESSPS